MDHTGRKFNAPDRVSLRLMNKPCFNDAIEPMTLGNMRANGVCSLDVSCWNCHHRAIMSADAWPNDVPVPTFGPRMVCTRYGIVGADAPPKLVTKRRGRSKMLSRSGSRCMIADLTGH